MLLKEKPANEGNISIILLIFALKYDKMNFINKVIMATPEFKYAPMFQMGKDDTEY